LHKKLAELSTEMREQEEKAFDFARERGSPVVWQAEVANALAEQAELVKAEAEFNRVTHAAKNELLRLREELKDHSEFSKTSETASLDPIWSQYNERVTSLKIDLSGLEAKLGQNSKEVLANRAQIERLEKELALFDANQPLQVANETWSISPVHASLQEKLLSQQSVLATAESSLAVIARQRSAVELRVARIFEQIPESELTYLQLNREVSAISDLSKEVYRQSLEAEVLMAESEFWRQSKTQRNIKGGIEIVDSAIPRKVAVAPRLKLIVAIAGIIGLSLGLSVALISEYLFASDDFMEGEEIRF